MESPNLKYYDYLKIDVLVDVVRIVGSYHSCLARLQRSSV